MLSCKETNSDIKEFDSVSQPQQKQTVRSTDTYLQFVRAAAVLQADVAAGRRERVRGKC